MTKIAEWMASGDTGASSMALAAAAMGSVGKRAIDDYPRDLSDFGRCWRLILKAPEAKTGLAKLAADGGPYWKALVARWPDLDRAYIDDMAEKPAGQRTSTLIREITDPIRRADPHVISFGAGASMTFGRP